MISFEFYPPNTRKQETQLDKTVERLNLYNPGFVSCTYGAGGSCNDNTLVAANHLKATGLKVTPHMSAFGLTRVEAYKTLNNYLVNGFDRLVVLRGDIPSGARAHGDFQHAVDLVSFTRCQFGDHFNIAVAGYPEKHPESPSVKTEIRHLKEKVDAGANSVITQYFYNCDAFFRFVDECRKAGIEVPITPGIMPISNFERISRFSGKCGAEIPRWMSERFKDMKPGGTTAENFAADCLSDMMTRMLNDGFNDFHIYTMNQYKPTADVLKRVYGY